MLTYRFTITTDASFDPSTKRASYAFRLKSDYYSSSFADILREPVGGPNVAELLAVERALLAIWDLVDSEPFLQHHGREGMICIHLNTDCKFVIDAMENRVRNPRWRELIDEVQSMAEGFEIKVSHVKAHTRNPSARSAANRWCDREARKVLKGRISKLSVR